MNLRRAARLVTQWYDQVLKPTGLKGTQFGLLFAIHWAGQPTFTPLARKMGMDRTTLARNLQVLQRRKLLRIEAGEDRRQQVITLTAKGQAAFTEAIPYWKKAQARAVALLKEDRWKAMAQDLQAIERLMKEE
jgi:DNA-binding MarR family transcriptional regulator